ncbi:MAG: capsule biosynthesis protein [Paracoccaceae bacterium]
MTTKPRAKKFRIKRPVSQDAGTDTKPDPVITEDGLSDRAQASLKPKQDTAPAPTEKKPRSGKVSSAAEVSGENTLDAIRREGLTGRQLRMARRVAQKQGMAPTSDFDAVRLLRAKGIDPFQRSNMLELVVPPTSASKAAPDNKKVQLPQTVPAERTQLPSEPLSPADRRANEIGDIQKDITRRRRRKMALLLTRLAFFVFLPTLLAGVYFFQIATPMYSTNSEFTIIQNEGGGGAARGLLAGTQFATSGESITTQGFLQSKEAMLRLDDDLGFKAHFQQDQIDAIQRLDPDATLEKAFKTYKKNVKIGFDPTEGVIRMEVVAADPQTATDFAKRLISYAEERINNLSTDKREDQMREARNALELAERSRRDAQEALVRLQLSGATLDPEGVIVGLRAQINQVELQLIEKELQLQALQDNQRPNRARVEGAQGDIQRLQNQLDKLNARMVDVSQGENSLANLSIRIQLAQADIATRDLMLQSAVQQLEQAQTEAIRQVRYLTVGVNPVTPQEASYPRSFENTILAFLIFSGIYLMISLTASILREQVTS